MRVRGFVVVLLLLWIMSGLTIVDISRATGNIVSQHEETHLAADPGLATDLGIYVIIDLPGSTIPSHSSSLSSLLTDKGILHVQYNLTEVLLAPTLLNDAQALIIDPSCGSNDGSAVTEEFITLLVRTDLPTILVGRAAWLVHRLRQTSPPLTTASIERQLNTTPEFNGAVFLSQPSSLTIGSLLTTETGLILPVHEIQAERSRLIDLTGTTTPAVLSPLRYESWPLDLFLFGPEDPTQWTGTGKGLFVNTLAYATALRETSLANIFQSVQSKEGQTLAGGLHHSHTPSLEGTYLAVHTVHDLKDFASFSIWRSDNQALVQNILARLYADFGIEAGFAESVFDSTVTVDTTAMGLWLVTLMGLESQFNSTKLTFYLSSRQSVEGGFSNHMTTTYHVIEALSESGGFGTIDTDSLESWLRSCVVDGDTGSPENWGGVAKNPTNGESHNIYSSQYVVSLLMLGKTHTDPAKLTEWILETSIGDGSFQDTIGADMHITRGTASALATMSVLGTLDLSNRTLGLAWFSANQLPSGGYGMGLASDDIVGKTWAAAEVAICLKKLESITGPIVTGLLSYINAIQSKAGFELMEEVPSLMWSFWLSEVNRLAHTGMVDNELMTYYLQGFEGNTLIQYPGHSNLTILIAPEYDNQQYYLSGVWAQFFGVGLADSNFITLSPSQVSSITFYLSMRQATTGHYKPSVLGTPHMQYTIAAVETLFQLNEMDTIWYRTAIESQVLSSYSSGSWSSVGWDLAPFVGVQSAIDFFCTRLALRLGLVTSIMATEIANVIEARFQYTDLWSLSWDVRTLALLNTSGFLTSLDSIDSDSILSTLRSAFSDAWFNSSTWWQPVFTEGVLDMVSTLGLRPRMNEVEGCTISATIPSSVQLGDTLELTVSITSTQPTHSVFINAFNSWTLFENVAGLDTLSLSVPSDIDAIGPQDISLMVWNWGMSRAFDSKTVDVLGSIEGSLIVHTPVIVRGNPILGTVSWALSGGGDAGMTDVIIRLSNGSFFHDWTSTELSPYDFSIPTNDLSEGPYNLIVTLRRSGCEDLVLWRVVSVLQPEITFLLSSSSLQGGVGNETLIPFTLHLESNGSVIIGEMVSITIWNESLSVVHTDTMLSVNGPKNFIWTPMKRGCYTFNLHFARNGVLMESEFNGTIDVFDQPSIAIQLNGNLLAPSSTTITVSVISSGSQTVSWVSVNTLVSLDGSVILDTIYITGGAGSFTFTLLLDSPGALEIILFLPPQGWLLGATTQTTNVVFGETSLLLSLPGQPIKQGTRLGISVLVMDWQGSPLTGAEVQIAVSWINGTIIHSIVVFTGADGTCSSSHTFNYIGDFRVEASYFSSGLNSSAYDSEIQRVYVTPTMVLMHDPTVNVGNSIEFLLGIRDSLGQYIKGRVLQLSITMSGVIVFQTQVTSMNGLASILWTPLERGLATIVVVHDGSAYYYDNFTDSSISVMEVVSGVLELDSSMVDLLSTLTITYTLESTGNTTGVDIMFQVLGMDLVPVWTKHVLTDELGVASAIYYADDLHGLLKATAAPAENQFMLGGDRQTDVTVMTYANTLTNLFPKPPSVGQLINVTLFITDDLGLPIDGLRITVKIYNIYDQLILTRTRDTIDGVAIAQFTPTQWGLYSVEISSSGGPSVYDFFEDRNDHEHTVYCPTSLRLVIEDVDIEVGETLQVVAQLLNVYGNPLVGMDVNIAIEGDATQDPVTRVTNASGHVSWEVVIDDQGFLTVWVEFLGLATYLPTMDSKAVHSSYGTSVIIESFNQGDIIAGLIPLNVSVLLVDSGGTPLEGRTIHWAAYNSIIGLVDSGSLIQQGVEPEVVEILLIQGGTYTVIFSFAGSAHYHSSNAAVNVLVLGTSSIVLNGPLVMDRASSENITISVVDELGQLLDLYSIPIEITMTNASGVVPTVSWLNGDSFNLSLLGLAVGDYTLNITVASSTKRIGSVMISQLKVITQSELKIVTSDFPGIVGQEHSVIVCLIDSLNDTMMDMTIWVSLYRPDGVEVYGSIGDRTPINLVNGLAEVSWFPSWTGNYTLLIRYLGNDWRQPTTLSMDILTRRLTILTVNDLEPVDYPMDIEIEVTLSSTLSKLGGAEILLTVLLEENIVLERIMNTNSRGIATSSLQSLLAGTYVVRISYAGTDSLAPCLVEKQLEVRPIVSINLTPLTQPYVNSNCSLDLAVSVLGVDTNWYGLLILSLYDPLDTLLLNHTLSINQHIKLTLYLVLNMEGKFTAKMTVLGLPVVKTAMSELQFTSNPVPISIVLDAGSTPIVAGAPIIALVGLALKRKLGSTIEGLPTEWTGA